MGDSDTTRASPSPYGSHKGHRANILISAQRSHHIYTTDIVLFVTASWSIFARYAVYFHGY